MCFDNERPRTDQVYAVHGSSGYHVHSIDYAHPHSNPKGFVPHFFEIQKADNKFVHVIMTCGMHTCGTHIRNNPDYETDPKASPYLYSFIRKTKIIFPIKDWNALVLFGKDLGFRLE